MKSVFLLIPIFVAAVLSVPSFADERVVWQIGEIDGNYEELAIARDPGAYLSTFPNDVTFTVGKDAPITSWPFIHPGPVDAWGGHTLHPFAVIFNLPEEPKGLYRLRIHLINTHYAHPPVLEVAVNDRWDRLELPAGVSDEAMEDPTKGKKHEISLPIAAPLLHKGKNWIMLTIVHGSHFLYDGLALTNDSSAPEIEAIIENVTLTPTTRFVRSRGKAKRVAQLSAQFSSASDRPVANVTFNGRTQTLPLSPRLFGSVRTDIHLDDLAEPALLEVTIESGGRTETASCEVLPEKHWKIYIMPTAHVDVGYSDLQENVKILHNDNMSLALDLCRTYPDFKWNTEVGWTQDLYLSMMPADRRAEFVRLAREGRIGCQVIYGNMLTGVCSHEGLIRTLYFTHAASKEFGIPFDMAAFTDVPTQVWTLPSILAGSGIRYFAAGLNNTRADSATRLFNRPFYWQGPDGASVLTWFSPGYGGAGSLGLSESMDKARANIDHFMRGFRRSDYPYDAAFSHGAFMDNLPLDSRLASIVDEWNRTYAYPRLILCRGPEFFSYIEKNFGDKIPTISGDAGVYWEDGVGSTARETSMNRIAKEDIVTAEKMFSLSSVLSGKEYPKADIQSAWKDILLFDEHTWGAAGSISHPESEQTVKQWAYKAAFARRASRAVAALKEQALDDLTQQVRITEPSVVVFNPLGWPVNQVVKADCPDGSTAELVADVPAMGLAIYPLSKLETQKPSAPEPANTLENRFYLMEFEPVTGAITRLYDKDLDRELLDAAAPYGMNEYVYISGVGDDIRDATRDVQAVPVTMFKMTGLDKQLMRVSGSAFNTPSWTTEVVLYENQKRIDFLNTLDKNPTYEKEGGYFAFPFRLSKPRFHIELPNGVVRPDEDMLPGGCMAWYTAQDFVTASDDTVSITWTPLDSPLITIDDVDRETGDAWPVPMAARNWPSSIDKGHLYAYVFNNYWFTNYKASQSGRLEFRFALTSARNHDPAAASRFGQSVRNPLLAKVVQPQKAGTGRSAIPVETSLLSVAPANVSLQTIKRAESGEGIIIRLREVGGNAARATVSFPGLSFKNAWSCNLVEEPSSRLPVSRGEVTVDLKANSLATILLK